MTQLQNHFLNINGQPFHYLDFGGANLPPLVFVHGTGLHAWTWLTHAETLRDRFHVYAFDHRGHGESTKELTNYSWGEMAEDLAAFIELLKLGAPLCVGHSMGATTTFIAAARHSRIMSGAVLVDPIILPQQNYGTTVTVEAYPMSARTLKRRYIWDSRRQMIESYEKKLPFKTWRPNQLEIYVNHGTEELADGTVRLMCPPKIEAECYLGAQAVDPWPLLVEVKIPTLVLRGVEADTRSLLPLVEISERLSQCQLIDIPEAGHFLPMEQPDILVDQISQFAKIL